MFTVMCIHVTTHDSAIEKVGLVGYKFLSLTVSLFSSWSSVRFGCLSSISHTVVSYVG